MNDADRKAFEDWWNDYTSKIDLYADEWQDKTVDDHSKEAWQAACEWRDSQVGEPFGWVNSQGQFMTQQEKQDAPIEFVEREGFDTPVYVAPPAAKGVKNDN